MTWSGSQGMRRKPGCEAANAASAAVAASAAKARASDKAADQFLGVTGSRRD